MLTNIATDFTEFICTSINHQSHKVSWSFPSELSLRETLLSFQLTCLFTTQRVIAHLWTKGYSRPLLVSPDTLPLVHSLGRTRLINRLKSANFSVFALCFKERQVRRSQGLLVNFILYGRSSKVTHFLLR